MNRITSIYQELEMDYSKLHANYSECWDYSKLLEWLRITSRLGRIGSGLLKIVSGLSRITSGFVRIPNGLLGNAGITPNYLNYPVLQVDYGRLEFNYSILQEDYTSLQITQDYSGLIHLTSGLLRLTSGLPQITSASHHIENGLLPNTGIIPNYLNDSELQVE